MGLGKGEDMVRYFLISVASDSPSFPSHYLKVVDFLDGYRLVCNFANGDRVEAKLEVICELSPLSGDWEDREDTQKPLCPESEIPPIRVDFHRNPYGWRPKRLMFYEAGGSGEGEK